MMMKKLQPKSGSGAVDAVVRMMAENPVGVQPWYKKIKPEHAAAVAELAEAWKSGRLGKRRRTAARVVSEYLKEQGIANVGMQGVDEWLQRV